MAPVDSGGTMGKGLYRYVAGLALAVSGCASILAPGPDPLPVTSEPPGAQVSVNGRPAGVTPTVVMLDRQGGGAVVRIDAPGFAPTYVDLEKELNPWVLGNCLGPSIFGLLVDASTGSVGRYPEQALHVELRAIGVDGSVSEPAVVLLRPIDEPVPVPPRDVRPAATVAFATGVGLPDILWIQGGPILGPVSLDVRFGLPLEPYLGAGLTGHVPLAAGAGVPPHALALSTRVMANLSPDASGYFDGPEATAVAQAGWIGTARFGLQGRALAGVGLYGNAIRPSVDLGIGWIF